MSPGRRGPSSGVAGESAPAADDRVECGGCGTLFEEDRGQPTCRSCPLADACRYVRCPSCGYENPVIPAWVESLLALWGRRDRGEPIG